MRPKLYHFDPTKTRGLSLEVAADVPFEEWLAIGTREVRNRDFSSWRLGDWWRHGQRIYGQRSRIVERDDWDGPPLQTLMDFGYVAGKFETSRRREGLSFKHHREVAALAPAEADALLDWASAPKGRPRSTRELRAEIARRRAAATPTPVHRVYAISHEPVTITPKTVTMITSTVTPHPWASKVPITVTAPSRVDLARAALDKLTDDELIEVTSTALAGRGLKLAS